MVKEASLLALLTYLTVGTKVSGASAITNVPVPALFAKTSVATGGTAAAFLKLTGAETADTQGTLDLSQPADIPALAIDE